MGVIGLIRINGFIIWYLLITMRSTGNGLASLTLLVTMLFSVYVWALQIIKPCKSTQRKAVSFCKGAVMPSTSNRWAPLSNIGTGANKAVKAKGHKFNWFMQHIQVFTFTRASWSDCCSAGRVQNVSKPYKTSKYVCIHTNTMCMHIEVLPSRKIYKNPIWSVIQHVKEWIRMYIGYKGSND